jgi:hypothetical protein
MDFQLSQIIKITGYGTPVIDFASPSDWDNGVLVGIAGYCLALEDSVSLLHGYNDMGNIVFDAFAQDGSITYVFISGAYFNVGISFSNYGKLAFYFRRTGTTIKSGKTFHTIRLEIYDEAGKVKDLSLSTGNLMGRVVRFAVPLDFNVFGVFVPQINTLIGKPGPITEEDIAAAMRLLGELNCDSQTALNLIQDLMPLTDPKELFDSVKGYLVKAETQNEPQGVIETMRTLVGVSYPVVAKPLTETRAGGVMVGIYPLNPVTINEKGPVLEYTTNVAIEVQAPDDATLKEVLDFIESVVNFINFETPATITQCRVWNQWETEINRAYASCVALVKTYKRRG